MLKVEGAENLVRDPETGAIVSTFSNGYLAYKNRKKIFQSQKEEIKELRSALNQIEDLKNEINKLKTGKL